LESLGRLHENLSGVHEGAAPRRSRLLVVLRMIQFHHSVFALPFALTAMLAAARGWPRLSTVVWIVVACVAARSMAMAYNRLTDRALDARNPRTAGRALPSGLVSAGFTWGFVGVSATAFVLASAMLNGLCLALSPVALLVLLGYSHTKRFTQGSHYVLGGALGLAPLGAWIAVRGSLEGLPLLLALGVLLWTAGFDMIYSCLDVAVDRREGLHSLPARVGVARALRVARAAHVLSVVCFALFLAETGLGVWAWVGLAASAALLVVEHRQVGPRDLSRVGPAFFTCNALVSVLFFVGCAIEILR
jgi:4-hydroxybenzoate polyprenyltransferase